MLRWRVVSLAITLGLLMGGGAAVRAAQGVAGPPAAPVRGSDVRILEIFYTPPVLVVAGERVTIPVDVVCARSSGAPCPATVTFGARADHDPAWRMRSSQASKGMRFDLTAPAARARSSVAFWIRARAGTASTALGTPDAPLRLFVARRLARVRVPGVPFGSVRAGRTVLSLPWGSGPDRAALTPGNESPTLGPSAFDVDGRGRVVMADGGQGRLAVFARGRLVREVAMSLGPRADVATSPNGHSFVADTQSGGVSVRSITPSGTVGPSRPIGPGILSDIRAVGGRAFVNLLPADQWVASTTGLDATAAPTTGMPMAADGDTLLRIGTERSVRLGVVRDGAVVDAIELRSDVRFGEVAFANSAGPGRYVVVVRTWRGGPHPADQYQAVVIQGRRVVLTFGLASRTFAETPPLSRFRMGSDGALYQLRTTAAGAQVMRYRLTNEPE